MREIVNCRARDLGGVPNEAKCVLFSVRVVQVERFVTSVSYRAFRFSLVLYTQNKKH